MRESIVTIPAVVLMATIISGCAGMGSPSEYRSELSYDMFKRDLGSDIRTYTDVEVPVAANCVATFYRGGDYTFKIEASWSGACQNGRAEGPGIMRFREYENRTVNGKKALDIYATVVEGVAVAGRCESGTITSTEVLIYTGSWNRLTGAGVNRCGSEGRPDAFVNASNINKINSLRDVKYDAFATLSPLSIDFFRTSFPEHQINGITYNPDFTASAILRSVFANPLVKATLSVAKDAGEKKVAEKRVKDATEAYERDLKLESSLTAPQRSATDMRGVNLLIEKNAAESNLKKVLAKQAQASKHDARNREISGAVKTPGEKAPDGMLCLVQYDKMEMDRERRELSDRKRDQELHYINICRDVIVDAFYCYYRPSSESRSPGDCGNTSDTHIGYDETYTYSIFPDHKFGKDELKAEAFCPAGSRPTDFKGIGTTQKTGLAIYDCIWN